MKKLFCLFFPFLLAACASGAPPLPPDNLLAPSYQAPAPGAVIVLLPPKFEAIDLEEGRNMLMDQLHRQLQAAGYKVVALDQANYETLWAQEVDAVGGIFDAATGGLKRFQFAQARGRLAQRVTSGAHAAMVLEPQLVMRMAELSGSSARWDGQERRLVVNRTGGDDFRHDGTTLALSVGVDLFADSGEQVASTHGGASLIYAVNIDAKRNEVRRNLFATDKEIGEGVALALSPLFKKSAQ
jgi:hypothetical protein